MKRTEPLKISQIVDNLFRDANLEDDRLRHLALAEWPRVVGPVINRLTVERAISGSTLLLRIASAPMRNELSLQRTAILAALNEAVGKNVLNDIKFF